MSVSSNCAKSRIAPGAGFHPDIHPNRGAAPAQPQGGPSGKANADPVFDTGNLAAPAYILSMHEERPRNSLPEQPSPEPEILPPDGGTAHWRGRGPGVFVFIDRFGHARRMTFAQPGPLAIILAVLAVGAIATAVLLLLLGFVLVWIPVSLALVAAVVLTGLWRRLMRGSKGQ